MTTTQIAVRLSDELLAELDWLVARGTYENRAAAVRAGIEVVAERDRRRRLDAEIVDGYRRVPPSVADADAARASLRDAIVDEPW